MLKLIEGLPPDVLAIEAVGKVTHEDYRGMLIPKAEAMMAKGPIKMLYVVGKEFTGFELEALWDDGAFGIKHWRDFSASPMVADHGMAACLGQHVRAFAFRRKCSSFTLTELAAAKDWIMAGAKRCRCEASSALSRERDLPGLDLPDASATEVDMTPRTRSHDSGPAAPHAARSGGARIFSIRRWNGGGSFPKSGARSCWSSSPPARMSWRPRAAARSRSAMAVVAPGLMVMVIIYFMGTVSGAHLNPAVTLAFAVRRNFPWRRVPGYILAQIAGRHRGRGLPARHVRHDRRSRRHRAGRGRQRPAGAGHGSRC